MLLFQSPEDPPEEDADVDLCLSRATISFFSGKNKLNNKRWTAYTFRLRKLLSMIGGSVNECMDKDTPNIQTVWTLDTHLRSQLN